MVEADGMLAIAGFFTYNVPVGHPAGLLAFLPAFEHDQTRVEGDFFFFFFFFAEPRLQLVSLLV
jgi:hypothetical protein